MANPSAPGANLQIPEAAWRDRYADSDEEEDRGSVLFADAEINGVAFRFEARRVAQLEGGGYRCDATVEALEAAAFGLDPARFRTTVIRGASYVVWAHPAAD